MKVDVVGTAHSPSCVGTEPGQHVKLLLREAICMQGACYHGKKILQVCICLEEK